MKEIIQKIHTFLFPEGNPSFNKASKWMWRIALAGVLAIAILFIGLSYSKLPSVKDLQDPESELASQVFAQDKQVLGRFYTENRVPVSYEELSPYLVQALIATEDERFYNHEGIDFKGLVRAVAFAGKRGGASTISQQLAKLLFTGEGAKNIRERLVQKLKEWIIAIRLERNYTKEEIIALYLNKFNFINGAYGIKAASEIYFNKDQADLDIQEAATLIGMLKNPSLFNPRKRPELVIKRRMVVLKQMQKNNLIAETEYDSLRQLDLDLHYTRQSHIDGLAPYFRSELAKEVKNILSQKEHLKADGTEYDIYRDGLKIYTTIDADLQRIAEEEMLKHMSKLQKVFFKSWKNMDPWKYKGDSEHELSVELRQEKLRQLLRTSDRYQGLRKKYLSDIIIDLNKETGLTFHEDDREIERIVRESEEKGYIQKLVSKGTISPKLASAYKKVLRSDRFPKLSTQWETLQEVAEKEFNKEVKMKVFAYNDKMETDTVMTPLDSVRYHRMFLQTGIIGVDPKTGYVKVWIGGINHKYFKYDHTHINRQVGSTFKPMVYATAIAQQGLSPCYEVYDLPVSIMPGDGDFHLAKEWTPRNANGKYSGDIYTLKEGLRKSKNTVSVHLMKQLGSATPVRNLADRMGIDKEKIPPAPSICLGSCDLSVMDMAGAYTTFANNGVYNEPIFITKITDKDGKMIYNGHADRTIERLALKPEPNAVMLEMMKYAGGIGTKTPTAGKTGTTNDYVDGWFIGLTPNLVIGTWVGGEDKWIRFRSLVYGQGAYMAKPFFRNYVKRLEKEEGINFDPTSQFPRPAGAINIELDCDEYKHLNPNTDDEEIFGDELGNDDFGDEEDLQ